MRHCSHPLLPNLPPPSSWRSLSCTHPGLKWPTLRIRYGHLYEPFLCVRTMEGAFLSVSNTVGSCLPVLVIPDVFDLEIATSSHFNSVCSYFPRARTREFVLIHTNFGPISNTPWWKPKFLYCLSDSVFNLFTPHYVNTVFISITFSELCVLIRSDLSVLRKHLHVSPSFI